MAKTTTQTLEQMRVDHRLISLLWQHAHDLAWVFALQDFMGRYLSSHWCSLAAIRPWGMWGDLRASHPARVSPINICFFFGHTDPVNSVLVPRTKYRLWFVLWYEPCIKLHALKEKTRSWTLFSDWDCFRRNFPLTFFAFLYLQIEMVMRSAFNTPV